MTCPGCQSENPELARFCVNCGTPLDAPPPVDGERRLVTVLFADVVGSTGIAERLDPEQVVELMNGAFAFMGAAVDRYEGTLTHLLGDAVLAVFGAPVGHEDDAERAVRAALEIRAAARDFARQAAARYDLEFGVRVGINTGLVVAGEVGPGRGAEYTAMGDAANVAARLQASAEPGTVLISATTYRQVKHLFEVRPRGPLAVRGRSAAIDTFEVVGALSVPAPARGLGGVRSAIVGRDAELSLLLDRVRRLREGTGAIVAAVGEAGVGKSRLVAELREQAGPLGIGWLEGRALSYAQSVVYHPWRQLLDAALGTSATDPPDAVRTRLHEAWAGAGSPADDLPFLEAVLGVESEPTLHALEALEGVALVERLGKAVLGYLRGLAEARPLVLVFDDLHWADTASLELLLGAGEAAAAAPILVLCLLRPEKQVASWAFLQRAAALGPVFSRVDLAPLTDDDAERLLDGLLDIRGMPASVREAILRRAEGNPFFLEEVLRGLIDSGHIVRRDGAWWASGEIGEVAIPESVAGVLSARIDRLPGETKRVALTASVVGRIFPHRLLAEVCQAAPTRERVADVGPHLATLAHEELVRERSREPELEYIFKHALTQEAAYELLLVRKRRELHRRTAETLERLYPVDDEGRAAALAHHYLRAGEWLAGAEHSVRAGARAVRLYSLHDALEHYDRAYHALRSLGDCEAGRLIDVLLDWTLVAYFLKAHERPAERDEIHARLEHAEALARAADDKRRLTRLLVWRGNVFMLSGFPTESFPMLRESHRLAQELGDEEQTLLPLFSISWWMIDDDPRGSIPILRKVLDDARRFRHLPGAREVEPHVLAVMGVAHARLGEFAEARRALDEALRLAPESGSPIKEADVELAAAMAYYDMGETARAIEFSRSGTEKALSIRGMECACTGTFLSGFGSLQTRDYEAARRSFEQALEMVAPLGSGMKGEKIRIEAGLALVRLSGGDGGAVADLEDALARSRGLGDGYGAALIAQQLAEAYLRTGEPAKAVPHLEQALGWYRSTGMAPYTARTLRTLARVEHAADRAEAARARRAEADAIDHELAARAEPVVPVAVVPVA